MTTDELAAPGASLPVPSASDRAVWSADRLDQPTLRALRDRATADLSAPWPVPLASDFARYARDGNRTGYESAVFARERRLSRAAVMAAVTLEARWLDEVVDGVSLLCEQSTWCWPAHDDVFRRGRVVPDVGRPFLDLGAGEAVAQLAWIDHLLGAQLDARAPGLRARILHEAQTRVLIPFVARRDWHWLADVHNWSAWIHGNVIVAGLALMPEGDPRTRLIDLAVDGMQRYVATIPADGAIDEGAGYWWLGACRALEALDVLAYASGGALELSGAMRETIAFPHRMHLGGDWQLNFADGVARIPSGLPWDALHRAARRVGDAEALAYAASRRRPGEPLAHEDAGLGRLLRALTDAEWAAAGSGGRAPLPRDVWLPSTQVFLARGFSPQGLSGRASSPQVLMPRVLMPRVLVLTTERAAGLTLAVKGGDNGEHHNHNDVGSVVVALNGVPVIVDPGRPTYTAQTFGPDRYDIWTMQSSWHSVPEIRGTAQTAGAEYRARDVEIHADDDAAEFILDIAPAYPRTDIRSWRRTARLDRHHGQITVRDSWHLDPGPDLPTRVHLMVAGKVELTTNSALITALDGAGTVRLSWEPATASGTVTLRPLDDPMLSDVWGDHLTRLEIDVTALGPVGTLTWTVDVVTPDVMAPVKPVLAEEK